MSVRLPALFAALLAAASIAVGAARAAGAVMPWDSSSCRYANDTCWTHGHPLYSDMSEGSSSSNTTGNGIQWGYSTSKLLNVGPDIPNLVAVVHRVPHGRVTSVWAALHTQTGRKPLHPHRIPAGKNAYAWLLGPVPDGDTLVFTTNYSMPDPVASGTGDASWTVPRLYARTTANGRPDKSAPVEPAIGAELKP
jgi:hypothetical protein